MDADGLWKAVDGFEAQQERTRPPLPTSPWKTGKRTPVSHSAHRPAAADSPTQRQRIRRKENAVGLAPTGRPGLNSFGHAAKGLVNPSEKALVKGSENRHLASLHPSGICDSGSTGTADRPAAAVESDAAFPTLLIEDAGVSGSLIRS
jgi:hypothetical protein